MNVPSSSTSNRSALPPGAHVKVRSRLKIGARVPGVATALLLATSIAWAAPAPMDTDAVRRVVDPVIQPLMAAHDIPGMSVAVTMGGQAHVLHYGVAAKGDARPVDAETIFEIGSISKVFTGTLGAWAASKKELDLADPASRHWPALAGTAFDRIRLLNLATYTASGLPLQFPDRVANDDAAVSAYFRQWQPDAAPGVHRQYSNPSIGLFGHLVGRANQGDFATAMTKDLLPALGLTQTYLHVPQDQLGRYAYGVAKDDQRVRVSPGPLDAEAYGVKTTAGDMIRFVQLAMDPGALEASLREAFALTQTGFFQVGPMQQGLGWEVYPAPVTLDALLAGNSSAMALEPQPATAIMPPRLVPARFVNKTGSTRGFGGYAAFAPDEHMGIVLLANRNYPNAERIKAAWAILEALR